MQSRHLIQSALRCSTSLVVNRCLDLLIKAGDPLPKKGNVTVHSGKSIRAGGSGALFFKLWQGDGQPCYRQHLCWRTADLGNDLESGVIPQGAKIVCDYRFSNAGTITMEVSAPDAGVTVGTGHSLLSERSELNFEHAVDLVQDAVGRLEDRIRYSSGKD